MLGVKAEPPYCSLYVPRSSTTMKRTLGALVLARPAAASGAIAQTQQTAAIFMLIFMLIG